MTPAPVPIAQKIHLPEVRPSLTHRRVVCGFKCYFTVGFFDNGTVEDCCRPAEVFVKIAKQGSVVAGLMDGLCALVSVALQFGIPWEEIRIRFEHHVFASENDEHHKSLLDGVVQAVDYLIEVRKENIG